MLRLSIGSHCPLFGLSRNISDARGKPQRATSLGTIAQGQDFSRKPNYKEDRRITYHPTLGGSNRASVVPLPVPPRMGQERRRGSQNQNCKTVHKACIIYDKRAYIRIPPKSQYHQTIPSVGRSTRRDTKHTSKKM